jgi:hypothetical protein
MICNDLAIANCSMARHKVTEPSTLNHVERGARMYFARMSCGHLREGFRAIQAVKDDPILTGFVNKCEPYAQAAFADLCECLETGKNYTEFEKYVLSIRNKASFHYESNQITSALEDRVNRSTSSGVCSVTMGENIHSNRLEFADAILDTIVCRALWGVQGTGTDASLEVERISDWCFQKTIQFLDFGGDFVRRYLLQHAI